MEKLYDINKNNLSIRCKVFCNDFHSIEKVVVFAHGFGGNKDIKSIERFAGQLISKYKNMGVVAFDLPCHGKDARKKLVLKECETYITLVNEDVKERFGAKELYAYGTSLGGYLFLRYLLENGNPYEKIALRSPAIKFYDTLIKDRISEEEMKKLEKGKDILIGFDRKVKINKEFLEEIQSVDVNGADFIDFAEDILIIQGTKDEIVSYQDSFEFADRNIIEFIPAEGADHRFKDPKILDQASNDIMNFFVGGKA